MQSQVVNDNSRKVEILNESANGGWIRRSVQPQKIGNRKRIPSQCLSWEITLPLMTYILWISLFTSERPRPQAVFTERLHLLLH